MRQLLALLTVAALTHAAALASYETPSLVEFDSATYEVSEIATNLVVTLVRTGDFRQQASCDFVLEDGSAEAGADFAAAGGRVTFRAGEGFKKISIPITRDGQSEGREDFQILLSEPSANCLLVQQSATVTIIDAAISPPPARLAIRPGLNETLLVSWPLTAKDGTLQRSANPSSGAWEPVPTAPKQIGDEWTVAEPLDGPKYFYRLGE
jgi:hypothetical protein